MEALPYSVEARVASRTKFPMVAHIVRRDKARIVTGGCVWRRGCYIPTIHSREVFAGDSDWL